MQPDQLLPFQRRFLKGALAPGVDVAALSIPRGNGKSCLAAHIIERALTPGDDLFVSGSEVVLLAGSLEQARLCFRFVRAALEADADYRFLDSSTKIGITHKPTMTRLRVISSNGKTAMGLVGIPLVVADEPGSWEVTGGELMHDALTTSLGKPGSPMKVIYIGTLAPSSTGWWPDLVEGGSKDSVYVQKLQGRLDKWESWAEIKRCNPLTAVAPEFVKRLKIERAEALEDSRLKSRFLSYRLNLPSQDEATVLLSVDDYQLMADREVPEPDGAAIVGIDLGHSRAFSAAVAVWASGRIDAVAVCPGIPSVPELEKRDHVPSGMYQRLVDDGQLLVADNLRVVPPEILWDAIVDRWGFPALIVSDRFRVNELRDVLRPSVPIEPRVTQWSSSSEDIRALRKHVKDGPFALVPGASELMITSLSKTRVQSDSSGNVRLLKLGHNNAGRDDVAAALVLAAGAFARYPATLSEPSAGPILV